jgi:acetyl-CoA carboxylase carboxyltransferase component
MTSWQHDIDELERRRTMALRMGGPDGVRRQHDRNKLTARERIDRLFDPGTFRELGVLTGVVTYAEDGVSAADVVPANVVTGRGEIEGRTVYTTADDFTISGGSEDASCPEKWMKLEWLAIHYRRPLVRLVDMAGGSVRLMDARGATKVPGTSNSEWDWVGILSIVPVAACAGGPCAGLGAQKVVASHFSVQIEGTGQVFAAGPRVVLPGVGESLDKEQLGGAEVHAKHSGLVDNSAASEADAVAQIRRWLSYVPSSAFEIPPCQDTWDEPPGDGEELLTVIPTSRRSVYDSRRILALVFDGGSIFEIGAGWGRGAITCFARLGGRPVGVLASDSRHSGGAQGEREAEKYTRFIDICDSFNVPVVNLHDQPGTLIGLEAERRGTIRKTLRTLMAINQATVPWCAVIIRRAYGAAGSGYGPWRGCVRVAWPSGHWGSLPIEGGVYSAHRREIDASEDPEAKQAALEAHYRALTSPFRTAAQFGIDDIIDPRDTRKFLLDWVEDAYRVLPERTGEKARGFRI